MSLTDHFIRQAKQNPRRIVLPEGDDPRILQAALRLKNEGIAHPILLSSETLDTDLPTINPKTSPDLPRYNQAYAQRRPGISVKTAARLMRRPLLYGAMMVAQADADAIIAGATRPTAQVISAAALTIGYDTGITCPSSFFIMLLPGPPERTLIYADAAVTVDPTPEELAQIAVVTARTAQKLLHIKPIVALLSFSTHGSAEHPHVQKVRNACRLARELAPDLQIDGELQADAALSLQIAQKKCPDSSVAGHANILIFPDLDAANIAYKLTQHLANARAIGPIMQGFRRPVNDLSRGATVDDIVAVAAIAGLQVED